MSPSFLKSIGKKDCIKSGIRFGALSGGAAAGAGLAVVEKTIFFGLITTSSVICPWLLAAYVGAGVAGGTVAVVGYKKLEQATIRKDFKDFI